MHTVNIHEAKTQLSKFIEQAVNGESFIIAKAGKPLVKVTKLNAPTPQAKKRIGFMMGQINSQKTLIKWGKQDIAKLFGVEYAHETIARHAHFTMGGGRARAIIN